MAECEVHSTCNSRTGESLRVGFTKGKRISLVWTEAKSNTISSSDSGSPKLKRELDITAIDHITQTMRLLRNQINFDNVPILLQQ